MKQTRNHFLTALKTYSINLSLVLLIFLSACPKRVQEVDFKTSSIPPWQTWGAESYGNLDFEQAVVSEARGDIETAVRFYELAFQSADTNALKEEAFVRFIGNNLKNGLSEPVLKQVSWYSGKTKVPLEQLSPRIALVVAHAYLNRNELDQMFAWFAIAIRNARSDSYLLQNIEGQAQGQIRTLSKAEFDEFEQRWYPDRVLGTFFKRERLRRAKGGRIDPRPAINWFTASTYKTKVIERRSIADLKTDMDQDIETDIKLNPVQSADSLLRVAVLLPLSGEYKDFAERVLEGIKIALNSPVIDLAVYDTEANPGIASRLCREAINDGAGVLLGPLLVKTTEAVARSCDSYSVPIVSFSKQEAVPSLGSNVFRLGATISSQVYALLKYSNENLGQRRFAVLYPKSGEGLRNEFFKQIENFPGVILAEASYDSNNEDSVTYAVNVIESSPVEAIFIADTLEGAFPALKLIKESELLKNVQIMGPAYWDDPVSIKGYGQLTDSAIYSSLFYIGSKTDVVADFVEAYFNTNGQEPELLAAQGYDAAMLVRQVLDMKARSSSFSGDLRSIQRYRGVTGLLSVKDNGEIEREASIIRLKRGKAREVYRAR